VKLVDFLQGKWLGHPLHPAIVHVPIGGWLVACVLDLVAWSGSGGATVERLALWCVGVGLAGALLAVPPGVADWMQIKKEKPAWKLGLWHMLLNLAAALVWAVNFGLRFEARDELGQAVTKAILLTSLTGTALLLVSAYLGSLMVFDQGIGVARTSKKKWRAIAVRAGARVPEEK
jgi:uncharacterized membrane protein